MSAAEVYHSLFSVASVLRVVLYSTTSLKATATATAAVAAAAVVAARRRPGGGKRPTNTTEDEEGRESERGRREGRERETLCSWARTKARDSAGPAHSLRRSQSVLPVAKRE